MPAQADTNDAHAYYDFAIDLLGRDDAKAVDALYWATRLEPTWADAYYARRIAMHLSDPRRLRRYWSGDRGTIESDDVRRIDSLYYRALTIDPFVSQRLDRRLFETAADEIAKETGGDPAQVRVVVEQEMNSWPAANRAWHAYIDGRSIDAVRLYADAIKADERSGSPHVDRARVFFSMKMPDSALAELTTAIANLHRRDPKDAAYVFRSEALAHHSVGVIQEKLGNVEAAREAYRHALASDPSYTPAHLQLAHLALDRKDTTGALAEMDLALQLRPDDAAIRYLYGLALAAAGKNELAETHLRRATQLNTVFAAPHFALASVLEAQHNTSDAAAEYRAFLARASRDDTRRSRAVARLEALGVS